MPECEAERRNRQALYLLENEWGGGIINVGELQRLLRGTEPDICNQPPDPKGSFLLPKIGDR